MDLIDRLKDLSSRIERQQDAVSTEEATKTAFVLPFIQALGYDVFNPGEVIPELTADVGVKKGEKVDYAIKNDDRIVMLIECKSVGSDLENDHAGQLYRYFSVTDARFGVLTDGVRYLFYSDLEKENKMDERPFFEFDLKHFSSKHVDELKKFTKSTFDLDTIISTASNLKYHRALVAEINRQLKDPSEDFVRLFTSIVYSGRITQQVCEKFTILTKSAVTEVINGRLDDRLKKALANEPGDKNTESETDVIEELSEENNGIVTTDEEVEAYRIIQAIGAEIVDPERIAMRDAKSYCSIFMDNNNRKPVCRFYFGKNKMSIAIYPPDDELSFEIDKVSDIYKFRESIKDAVNQYSGD